IVETDAQRLRNAHVVFVEDEKEFVEPRHFYPVRCAGVVARLEIPANAHGPSVLSLERLAAILNQTGAEGLYPAGEVVRGHCPKGLRIEVWCGHNHNRRGALLRLFDQILLYGDG